MDHENVNLTLNKTECVLSVVSLGKLGLVLPKTYFLKMDPTTNYYNRVNHYMQILPWEE